MGINAEENTNAEFVWAHCHSINAALLGHAGIKVKKPLDFACWSKHLKCHADKPFVDFILNSIKHRVHIGYTGSLQSIVSKNWPSANQFMYMKLYH